MLIYPVLRVGYGVDTHLPMSVADLMHCNLMPISRSDAGLPDREFVSLDQKTR